MSKLCTICNITLDEHDFSIHMQGKRHLKNVEVKEYLESSVYVSRMPPGLTKENVVDFFKKFGTIKSCKFEQHFAIVQFEKKEPVTFLLSKPIFMDGHILYIKSRRLKNSGQTKATAAANNPERAESEIVFADLKTRLQAETTLDGEISVFLQTVQLSEGEVSKNWQAIHSSLLEALKPAFPKCEIIRFGSSITGLCFKGSDIDVYLDIGEPIHEDDDTKPGWTPRKIFKEVKFCIYKRRTIFERIVLIPRAKTPIIKFYHVPTATSCDISFKNGLGVINSQMIKQLLCLDVRLKPLMTIVKYWIKTYELSGCGKFTNYAIVMLIIFYLQQPETKLLPTIVELQKGCKPVYRWNWQVNFDRNAKFPSSNNRSSVPELLAGFFEFYVNFPFDKAIISPLDGCAHSRENFAKGCTEKGGDANHFGLDRSICVQDPIELDNNITSGVTAKALEAFQKFCRVGVEVCEAALKDKDKPFLLNLFTTLPPSLEKQVFEQITIYARTTMCAGLPKNYLTSYTDEEEKRSKKVMAENHWCVLTQDLVENALKRVFKMEVQKVTPDPGVKQRKVAETSDVHTKDNGTIVLECSGNYCLIGQRKDKSFCIDPSLSCMDKEAMLSDELLNKQKADGVKPTKLDFTCTINREQDPLRLVLGLRDRNSAKKRFRPLATYLRSKLPNIIEKELMHIIQYK